MTEKLKKGSYALFMTVLIVLALVCALAAFCLGNYSITAPEVLKILFSGITHAQKTWTDTAQNVVFTLRAPRIAGAMLVGGSLALSGAAYQGIFKNPLVAPDLLGVSSGACVGAAIGILMEMTSGGIQLMAFVFGILTVGLTTLIPRLVKNTSMTMLVLAGIIVGGLMSSILGIIKYLADPETELAAITYWQMGSLAKITTHDLMLLAPPMIIAIILIIAIRWQINLLSLGEGEAKMLGVHVKAVRGVIIVCATLLTASAVCTCGTVGWVGLVIPHLARMLVGVDNTKSIPATFVLGAIFMLVIDTVARCITTMELPLSILTGLIGAPFYFFILKKQRMRLT